MKDFLVKNSWAVFFIGFFVAMANVLGKYSYIGFGIMLLSFYLFYLESKQPKND
jgi:mannose/fructose/N-acetylgalactosamine-specific phosphotransferase system component IIC